MKILLYIFLLFTFCYAQTDWQKDLLFGKVKKITIGEYQAKDSQAIERTHKVREYNADGYVISECTSVDGQIRVQNTYRYDGQRLVEDSSLGGDIKHFYEWSTQNNIVTFKTYYSNTKAQIIHSLTYVTNREYDSKNNLIEETVYYPDTYNPNILHLRSVKSFEYDYDKNIIKEEELDSNRQHYHTWTHLIKPDNHGYICDDNGNKLTTASKGLQYQDVMKSTYTETKFESYLGYTQFDYEYFDEKGNKK